MIHTRRYMVCWDPMSPVRFCDEVCVRSQIKFSFAVDMRCEAVRDIRGRQADVALPEAKTVSVDQQTRGIMIDRITVS